jgi:hypothetical protein
MKRSTILFCAAASILALSLLSGGCSHEVSRSSKTTVRSDGSVKQNETVVTQSPDGTVTREETTKRSNPAP